MRTPLGPPSKATPMLIIKKCLLFFTKSQELFFLQEVEFLNKRWCMNKTQSTQYCQRNLRVLLDKFTFLPLLTYSKKVKYWICIDIQGLGFVHSITCYDMNVFCITLGHRALKCCRSTFSTWWAVTGISTTV